MRLAFMGTPDFAVPGLSELIAAGHEIAAVYTQPPRPAGRGHKLRKSPIHELAESFGLEVRTPENFKSAEDKQAFQALDLDLAVVIAYGLILPKAILESPRLGCINLHGSLLPRWRGAAPVQRAIMAGDTTTGVQLMQMERGLDTGPILLSETVEILETDTSGSLHDKLSHIGANMLPRALAALSRDGLVPTTQATDGVTYAEKITPEEARIDWRQPAAMLDCHIRGLSPFPGAWFDLTDSDGKSVRCKALMSQAHDRMSAQKPGTIIEADTRLIVACGEGAVSLKKLQRSGKSVQAVDEFLRGFPLSPGQMLA
ncbi:methionyl-tRNA formyltransferase [Parvularcula sp. IMCC14364]|uniref:methionyl-tRNA formyltransferase n=1 Tax=Parvularcula sp. IMCC14364 TaxID=3067902 RepID=UPI002742307B|nr:methionyl-tRNA formyltransferase [Parvularcula sp. IMCC14364]